MSPGKLKPGKLASARLAARPTPVSSIPPHHTGTPWAWHRSWMASPQTVLRQGLLDQQQAETIQRSQGSRCLEGISRVGIHLQAQAGESAAHGLGFGDVPARFDLDLDPAVALLQVSAHPAEQRIRRILDANRDAYLN